MFPLRRFALLTLVCALTPALVRSDADTSSQSPPEVVREFFACLEAGDLDCLMATYTENPTINMRARSIHGTEAVRMFLAPIVEEFRQPETWLEWRVAIQVGDLLLMSWNGVTSESYYELGNMQFELAAGKIVRHRFEPGYEKYPNLGSWPESIVDLDGTAIFFASDAVHGKELWRSDGTPAGTHLLKDLAPGERNPDASGWVKFKNHLYLSYCWDPSGSGRRCSEESGLWRTDGTPEGTEQVKHVRARCTDGDTAAALDELFVFIGEDPAHGSELWRSDGTADGTRLVKDIRPGPENSRITELFRAGDLVYFGADDGKGTRLWRTDGTPAGTIPIAKLRGGYQGRHWAFSEFEGDLLFTGDDGKRGGELWRSDGTPKGTRMVKDVRPGSKGSSLFEITLLDGVGYFSATDGKEREVFRTDGTESGTYGINANPTGSSYPDHMAISGGRILFYASDERRGGELWRIEPGGSARIVRDIYWGAKGSHPNLIVDLDGIALFAAEDSEHGMELWRSDGTLKGTVLVKDLAPGPDSGRPREMVRVGEFVFFNANDGRHGTELWRTDGTPEGTILLGDLNPRPENYRPAGSDAD